MKSEAKHENDYRRTILVVDDEPVNLHMMGNILSEDYDVLYAQSGEDALKEVNANKDFLSLILLDLHMDGMHGYEVLGKIMEDEELRTIPVIVLTSDKEAEVESLQRGAVDFLKKPFEKPDVIKVRIRRAIELSEDRKRIYSAGPDPLAALLENLGSALSENQFSIVFQPKYDIRGEEPKLCSAEVLVRWQHPKQGNIRPDVFIPLFEEKGLVNELDRYVWREAARQVKKWKDMYGISFPVSVNVSRVDIFDPDLMCYLEQLTSEFDIGFEDLHLEITETAYADNTSRMIQIIKELQKKGFKVEMDDFGKGYSSLNMLTSLPIDALKLDMGFIRNIVEDKRDLKMVEIIIEIGRFLQVPVIAEGVECKEQYQLLKDAGCDIIQGYYFSKPVSAAEFGCLLEKEIKG